MQDAPFQNLLVTGGSGFIGSNFIRYLLEESGFSGRVINLDALTYAGNPENLDGLAEAFPERYRFEHGDIRDPETLRRVVDTGAVDGICHFAAESHVDRSIDSPGDFSETNILGTFRLLEQARAMGDRLHLFHHVSTDEVFGSLGAEGAFTENSPYRPNSPYSASKAGSDHLVRAYHTTYGLPVTLSNCSNNYGPYQFPEKLIPLMLLQARDGQPLPVYGDGLHVRDWLYVRDHCVGIWAVMTRGRQGETYNIGGRNESTNLRVVETLCDLLDELLGPAPEGPRRRLMTFVPDRPGHDRRYAIDCSRMERELDWTPRESFESGLRQTVQWYLDHPEWVEHVRSGAYQDWMARQYPAPAPPKGGTQP